MGWSGDHGTLQWVPEDGSPSWNSWTSTPDGAFKTPAEPGEPWHWLPFADPTELRLARQICASESWSAVVAGTDEVPTLGLPRRSAARLREFLERPRPMAEPDGPPLACVGPVSTHD